MSARPICSSPIAPISCWRQPSDLRQNCVGTLRMALHEGLAGLVAEQVRPVAVEQVKNHPRFKYFRESGEDALPVVPRSAADRPRRSAGRARGADRRSRATFREIEIRMLVEAAAQVAPVISEARTLARFIAPLQERLWSLARNLWWSWDHDSISLFRDLDPVRCRELNQNPISLLNEIPLHELERAPANSSCTAASITPTAASGNICTPTAPGAPRMRAFCGLAPSLISPPNSAFTSPFPSIPAAWAFWPAITSRALPIWVFRSSASGSSTARAISPAPRSQPAGSTKSTCRPTSISCRWSPPSARTDVRSPSRSIRGAAPSAPESGG